MIMILKEMSCLLKLVLQLFPDQRFSLDFIFTQNRK